MTVLNQGDLFSSEYKQIHSKYTQAMLQSVKFHNMAWFNSDLFEHSNDTLWQQDPCLEETMFYDWHLLIP